MGSVTEMREGEYRLLVLDVDKARAVYAFADLEVGKNPSKENTSRTLDARDVLLEAQTSLEKHVGVYGIPKPSRRV